MRYTTLRNRPKIDVERLSKLEEEKKEEEVKEEIKEEIDEEIDEITKQRYFQQDTYIKFLKRFINEKCEYEYQHMQHIDDIKDAYLEFMNENKNYTKNYNVNFGLTPSDIPKIDNRFEFKGITVCKHCKTKQYKGCCADYVKLERTKLSFIVNFKIKELRGAPEWMH